jgi:putative inorganic carbon (HCO3(-)) transporter
MLLKLKNFPFFQIASTIGVSLILGGAIIFFPPLWVLAAIIAIYCFAIIINRPEFALLAILTATSSIIFEDSLPLLHVGIGSLHLSDVLLLGMLCLILIRGFIEPGFKIVRTPLDLPLLSFYGIALFSTIFEKLNGNLSWDRQLALQGTRIITYYLTFFIVTNFIRKKGQLRFLVTGILILGSIVAFAMVVQYIAGDKIHLFPGRVETVQTGNITYTGVTRVLPPGQSLVFLSFITLLSLLAINKTQTRTIITYLLTMLAGIGVLLTFNRNFWVGIGIALLCMLTLIKLSDIRKLIMWAMIAIALTGIIIPFGQAIVNSQANNPVDAIIGRLSTLVNINTLSEGSLTYRYIENNYALQQIITHPILGLGLGVFYRPYDPRLDFGSQILTNYIHSGQLGLILDTGILGYICFLWLSGLFILRGLKFWKTIQESEERAIFLAMTLSYIGIFAAAIVSPIFQQWYWTPVLGIMMGINEVIFSIDSDRSQDVLGLEK